MSHRTLAEFGKLLAGERTLLAELSSGEIIPIGGNTMPSAEAGKDRQLRGDFLRYLLLGGCDELKDRGFYVHEKGVRAAGALIKGVLDLEGCRIPRDIGLINCRFEVAPVLRSAVIDNLVLSGSSLPGLVADRLEAKGSVFLRDVEATGELRFLGAKLGGAIGCVNATLTALNLSGAKVEGAFFLRGKARITGLLNLTSTQFGVFNDELDCWPKVGNLALNRCQYGAITGGPVTAEARIRWLSLQDESQFGQDFWPQPWEQCAKVLREMGHREDARAILIEKEKRQRADRRKNNGNGWLFMTVLIALMAGMATGIMYGSLWGVLAGGLGTAVFTVPWFKDTALRGLVAYGHKPLRALYWLVGLWVIGIGVFYMAQVSDAIKPNDVRILRSAEWAFCHPDYVGTEDVPSLNKGISQITCFEEQPEAWSYPKFNAAVYSADTLLPIVALEMQSFWIPNETATSRWGQGARYFLWLQIVMGWALSLLAVAGFSGLIKSD